MRPRNEVSSDSEKGERERLKPHVHRQLHTFWHMYVCLVESEQKDTLVCIIAVASLASTYSPLNQAYSVFVHFPHVNCDSTQHPLPLSFAAGFNQSCYNIGPRRKYSVLPQANGIVDRNGNIVYCQCRYRFLS